MTRRDYLAAILAFSSLTIVAVGLAGRATGTYNIFFPALYTGSTLFVATAVACGALKTWPGRFLLLGLAGCWFGDVLGPTGFYRGALAFALAHVFFSAALILQGVHWRRLALLALPIAVSQGLLLYGLLQYVPRGEQLFVSGYTAIIATMVALTLSQRFDRRGTKLLMLAAVIFYVSDLFVARWRFVSPGPENAFLCYPLYYTACVMFAWAAGAVGPQDAGDSVRSAEALPQDA
jgi:hypothetical protein